jgi:hypothetical protein
LLKWIEGKFVLARRLCWRDMGSNGNIRIDWGYGNLMSNLELTISGRLKERPLLTCLMSQF